jgi:hypothetical protein
MSELKVNTISANTELEVTVDDAVIINETLEVSGIVTLSNLSAAGYVTNSAAGIISTSDTIPIESLDGQISADRIGTGDVDDDDFNALIGIDTTQTIQDQFDNIAAPAPAAPVGSMMYWSTETPPTGWGECNGAQYLKTEYSALFAIIAHRFTPPNEQNGAYFRVPNTRGLFVRCLANGDYTWENQTDSSTRIARPDLTIGDNVGTVQANQNIGHAHVANGPAGYSCVSPGNLSGAGSGNQDTSSSGGTEARPNNIVFMMIIKL